MTLREKLQRITKGKTVSPEVFSQLKEEINELEKSLQNELEKVGKLAVDSRELYASKNELEEIRELFRGIKIPEAIKGERGEKGLDGRDGKDGKDGRSGKDGIDGKDGKDGVDGKDGITEIINKKVPITTKDAEDIVQKIEKLPVAKRLDATKLKNIGQAVSQFANTYFVGGGSNSSGEGTTDHSALTNLDYTSSGHTGFQPEGDYALSSDIPANISDLTNDSGFLTEESINNTIHNKTLIYSLGS